MSADLGAFHTLALAFCAWCEAAPGTAISKRQAAQWLARLHAAALDLPETDSENDWGLPELPADELSAAEQNLHAFSGWYYRTIFDPEPSSTDEPVMGDVGDDLLDIYKDIKAGNVLAAHNRIEDAVWHWSFMHRVHWGKHAVGALAAIHAELRHEDAA